jgi:Anion-transporting ATPase
MSDPKPVARNHTDIGEIRTYSHCEIE